METVVHGVNGRAVVGNKPLARSLARVKELMDDADDVVDELDYCRLQHQVEGVNLAPATETEGMVLGATDGYGSEQANVLASTAAISDRKNRSKERDYFRITPAVNGEPARAKCIDCGTQVVFSHGTSVLRKHRNSASCKKKRAATEETPNRPSAGDGVQNRAAVSTIGSEGSKRTRIQSNVATITHPWDNGRLSKRIHEITHELGRARVSVIDYLKDSVAILDRCQTITASTRVRTSGSVPGQIFGRFEEKDNIMSVMIGAAEWDSITVIPIVGIPGVGKTALAKLVYNDPIVESQFERRWVWVSDIFDKVRVSREILDVVTLDSHEGSPHNKASYEGASNYSKLQEVLKEHVACWSKRFLLVLDDVSDCMDSSQWKDLLDALGSSCMKGNVIIVTVRNLSVAQRLGTVEPVKLRALKNDDFLLLFKSCAFGDNSDKEHLDLGHQIAAKLKGNPLAAETAAEMLREQPSIDHWKNIIKNGVWESLKPHGGIMTSLQNSYYQLPYHLQQCFLFCSIFPNNHSFHVDSLVYLWISLRFVKSIEIGLDCFNALVNLGFFEEVGTHNTTICNKKCYAMCGIMHEFARLISRTEFATIDGLECKEVLPTIRHLSILINSVYREDERRVILRNVKFEEKLRSLVSTVRRLRTLILIGHYDSLFFRSFHTFMCNSANCTHLRYLKVENKGSSEALPISLSKFYHLEVLEVGYPAITHGLSDLVCMRHPVLTVGALRAFSQCWPACLQTIHLEDCEGWEKFPSFKMLLFLTKLKLRNIQEVTEVLIPSLEELVLINMPKLERCSCNSVRNLNSSLRVLEIRNCCVLQVFPLFGSYGNIEIEQNSWLPHVSEVTIHDCPYLMVSHPLPPSSNFCKLSIKKLSTLPTIEGSSNGELKIQGDLSLHPPLDDTILSFHSLRSITGLQIKNCKILSSISCFRQLVCLKWLDISCCPEVFSSNIPPAHTNEDMITTNFEYLPSLEGLRIAWCGITGEWLSAILRHFRSLYELSLVGYCGPISGLLIEGKEGNLSNLTSAPNASSPENVDDVSTRLSPDQLLRIPSNLIPSLKKISIEYFCDLEFLGNKEGLSGFTSLEVLTILDCSDLIGSLVHEDENSGQAEGRWLLPCSLEVLVVMYTFVEALHPCFPGDVTHLTEIELSDTHQLKSLRLCSCTALEVLRIKDCQSLDTLEGFQFLRSLRILEILRLPGLKSLQLHSCTALEELRIEDCKSLDTLEGLQFLYRLRILEVSELPELFSTIPEFLYNTRRVEN